MRTSGGQEGAIESKPSCQFCVYNKPEQWTSVDLQPSSAHMPGSLAVTTVDVYSRAANHSCICHNCWKMTKHSFFSVVGFILLMVSKKNKVKATTFLSVNIKVQVKRRFSVTPVFILSPLFFYVRPFSSGFVTPDQFSPCDHMACIICSCLSRILVLLAFRLNPTDADISAVIALQLEGPLFLCLISFIKE